MPREHQHNPNSPENEPFVRCERCPDHAEQPRRDWLSIGVQIGLAIAAAALTASSMAGAMQVRIERLEAAQVQQQQQYTESVRGLKEQCDKLADRLAVLNTGLVAHEARHEALEGRPARR